MCERLGHRNSALSGTAGNVYTDDLTVLWLAKNHKWAVKAQVPIANLQLMLKENQTDHLTQTLLYLARGKIKKKWTLALESELTHLF